jgi:hypothetical protein
MLFWGSEKCSSSNTTSRWKKGCDGMGGQGGKEGKQNEIDTHNIYIGRGGEN